MNLNIGNIGIWGFRHYEFLKQNRPSTVGVMRMNGTLEGYLKNVNQETMEMLETLVRQYAKAEGVAEALKRTDQLEWVCRMNNIRSRVEEVVLNEIIFRYNARGEEINSPPQRLFAYRIWSVMQSYQ